MQTDKPSSSASLLERFFERLSLLSQSTFPRVIAGCCVLLILGNSVALAATQTVPGDTLYPVKINLLEPAQALVTITSAGKAAWASTCVRRRLAEAEHLIAQDRLTPDAWTMISASIAQNAKVADDHIVTVSKSNASEAADLSANLHLALNAHGKVFTAVARASNKPVLTTAATDIAAIAESTATLYDQTQNAAAKDRQFAEQTAMRVMESASGAAGALIDSETGAEKNISNAARLRGNDARRFLKTAQDSLQAGQFNESLRNARLAQQKTEEGDAFVRLGAKFDATDSGSDAMITNVPLSVCGATILNVTVPAIATPAADPFSGSKPGKDHHHSSPDHEHASVMSSSVSLSSPIFISSSSRSSAVPLVSSSSSISSVMPESSISSKSAKSSSSVISQQKVSSASSTSSVSSASSALSDIIPKVPLLH